MSLLSGGLMCEVDRGHQQRGLLVLCSSDMVTLHAVSSHMQRCADTLIHRDGATVSAAAVRNRVWLPVFSRPAARVVPRDSAGAFVDQQIDAVVSATVRISDAADAFR